jgi:hypothetical protein
MHLREDSTAGNLPTPVDLALDHLSLSLDHLVKIVEDGGLDGLDDAGLVGFLLGFERIRNRLPLVDHATIGAAVTRELPARLTQATPQRMLAAMLRLSLVRRPGGSMPPRRWRSGCR